MNSNFNVEEAAQMVGVKKSTIKKYYLLFEEEGYKFNRTTQGQLFFSSNDILLFKKLIELKNEPGMKVSNAIKILLEQDKGIDLYSKNEILHQICSKLDQLNNKIDLLNEKISKEESNVSTENVKIYIDKLQIKK